MILTAFLADSAQVALIIIPVVGWILAWTLSTVAPMVFGVWFSHDDVSLMHPDRVLGFLGTIAGEQIPVFDGIPFFTSFVAYTVIKEWRTPIEI